MRKLVDANVWLALAVGTHVHHRAAVAWFDRQATGSCCFCRLTQLALLRHLTNRAILKESVQSQREAWGSLDALLADERVIFLGEPEGLDGVFRGFAAAEVPAHTRWSDDFLAAFAVAMTLCMATFDRDFRRFDALPLELIEA